MSESITFATAAARPKIARAGRPKAENPYAPLAAHLASDLNETVVVTVPVIADKTDEQSAEYALRKIREAGTDAGITIRTVIENPETAPLTVTAWGVPMIKRARKAETDKGK